MMANHGRVAKYDHEIEGINSRLDGLQSAILSVKLRYLDQWNRQRQEAAKYYHQCLKHLDLPLPKCNSQGRHVYHLYVTRVKNRNHVMRELKNCGVVAGIHYPIALPFLKAYSYMNYKPIDFPIAYSQMGELISLPIFPEITKNQIEYVACSLKAAISSM